MIGLSGLWVGGILDVGKKFGGLHAHALGEYHRMRPLQPGGLRINCSTIFACQPRGRSYPDYLLEICYGCFSVAYYHATY